MVLACIQMYRLELNVRLRVLGYFVSSISYSVSPEWPRRRALDHSARMLKGVPSPICCQPGPKRWPVLAAATCEFVIMRGGLACGHRVSPHGRTVSFVSLRWHPEQREGWSGRQLLYFWQSHASVSRGSYVGNACEWPPASVDPPAEVSTSLNHTTKWTVYKSGTGEVLSAVEAGSVARLCS